jgi:hypothetical protein
LSAVRPLRSINPFFLRPLSGAHEETARAQQAFQLQSRLITTEVRALLQEGAHKVCDFDASPYASDKVYYMVREIDTIGGRPELHLPSPSPWKGEGVRQRGSSINQTEHCAIAMHIARGEQTSFVISMLFPET